MRLFFSLATLFLSHTLSAQGKFFGGNGDGFASATITNVILPVRVLNFSVSKTGGVNKAELLIQSNEAIHLLELQRSRDGTFFTTIDSEKNEFTGTQVLRFVFNDAAPAHGKNYYRVKINRFDATFLYSGIVALQSDIRHNQLYYSSSGKTIQYEVYESGLLRLANSLGQIVYTKTLIAGSGILSMPSMSAGIYFLHFGKEVPITIWVQ